MMSLQDLCQAQTRLRERLDKYITTSKKTATAKRNLGFYKARIQGLKEIWDEFQRNDITLDNAAAHEEATETSTEYFANDLYGATEGKYFDYLGDLMDGLEKCQISATTTSVVPATTSTTTPHEIQLPRISLPKFNGDYDLWRSFHDVFVSLVHSNSRLSSVQKLYYLKECLVGEAQTVLRHVPTTHEDYQPAWAKLKERYENKRMLVNHQLKTFLSIPKLSTETFKGMKELIETTSECLQQLKNLDVDTSSWDAIVIHLLVQKLPFTTLRLWEEELGATQTLPSLATFRNFLNTRLRVLESIADALVSKPLAHPKPTATQRITHTHHAMKQNCCPVCHQKHYVHSCRKYQAMSSDARRKAMQTTGRCLNCLSSQHSTNDCTSKYRCRKCQQKHHTSLHEDTKHREHGSSRSNEEHLHQGETSPTKDSTCTKSHAADGAEGDNQIQNFLAMNHRALLSTALVIAHAEHGKSKTLRCLIDSGSESSFITEAACNQLGCTTTNTTVTITGLNTSQAATAHRQVNLTLKPRGSNTGTVAVDFLVLNQITDHLPTRVICKEDWNHLNNLQLADPTFWKPGRIDALLGAETYAEILQDGIRRGPNTAPIGIKTLFGWIIIGPTKNKKSEQISAFTARSTDQNISEVLTRFWDIEEVPAKPILTKEEELCEQIFKTTHKRTPTGRYQVTLPFIDNQSPSLGQSRPQALKRFASLQRQFARNPQLQEEYSKCMDEYIELGHMEAVEPPTESEEQYYIPHHAVFKESTTTKLRVVFDASAKTTNGKSLNEHLLTGPTLQPKLFATLLNWRKYKIAINADIEKMYRMIEINPKHHTFQRIIWRHPQTMQLQDYKLKTVTFGTSSAPYLAIRTLQQLADDERKNWPAAAKALYTSFYVDDLLTGADSVQDAKLLQTELMAITKAGGFNLRKWASNNQALLDDLPVKHRELKTSLQFTEDQTVKTLGIRWHPGSDHFTFSVTPLRNHDIPTKRNILSDIASLYDPLGWLSPVIIIAKMLMQTLWITGFSWDQRVSTQIETEWETFKRELSNLEALQIPRWINYSTTTNAQLHGFCDASARAYAAVLYLRVEKDNGEIISTLLTSKTKVAPIKPTTIPRLELNGAVILARLLKCTIEDMQLQHLPVFAWTDSTIALQWVKEQPSKWKTYVANRVVEVQEVIRYDQWRHIPTKDNPADLASRGIPASNLLNNQLWWHGPNWLTKSQPHWPQFKDIKEQTDLEARKPSVLSCVTQLEDQLFGRYSSLTRLTHIIALILRFKHNCQNPKAKRTKNMSVVEWQEAENTIWRFVQQAAFSEEYNNLLNNKPLARNSRLLKLNPFLDKTQLIRVGGRLQNAPISYDAKHPIILPQEHPLTHLLINKIHLDTLHGGTSLVLSTSRQKYWILNARRCITSRIHKCVICARQRGETMTQLMGHLPTPRVSISKPFTSVGIDYAGPITVKASTIRNAKLHKAYICVFVCLSTKAIHIELVSNLSSQAFLAALRRFIARRGLCTDIYSDCGSNFIGARSTLDKDIKQALKEATTEAARDCATRKITWHFNPPGAPHFGGLWEASVKSIKHHLYRTVRNATLTFEEYATLLIQIEACLNSRPLCYIRNDPEDTLILTPGHFLIGQAINAFPEPRDALESTSLSQRWNHIQVMVKQFWKEWTRDYLHQLQQRPKWLKEQTPVQIGDVVLVKHENTPPTKWPLGTIEEVFPGKDGLIRVVQVRTIYNTFQRPITKICRLPVDQTRRSTCSSP